MKLLGCTAASGILSILGCVPRSDAGDVILPACAPHVDGPAPRRADVRPDRTRILAISTRKACAGNRFFRPMRCLRHEDRYDSGDCDAWQLSYGVLLVRGAHHTFLFHQLSNLPELSDLSSSAALRNQLPISCHLSAHITVLKPVESSF